MLLSVCYVLCFWFRRQRAHMVSGESWSRQAGGPGCRPPGLPSLRGLGSLRAFPGMGPTPKSPPRHPPPPRGPVVVCAESGALVCLVLSEDFLTCCPTAACQVHPLCWGLHGCGRRGVSRDVEGGRVGCWGAVARTGVTWQVGGFGFRMFLCSTCLTPHPSPASARPLS